MAINQDGNFELTPNEAFAYAKDQQITNDEYDAILLGRWREMMGIDVEGLPREAKAQQTDLFQEFLAHGQGAPKTKHDILQNVRYQLPFVSILPLPHTTIGLICTGTAADVITLPDNTVFVRFSGSTPSTNNYIVDMSGTPIDFVNSVTAGQQFQTTGIINPFDQIWYVEGIRQIQVVGPAAAAFSVSCWQQVI